MKTLLASLIGVEWTESYRITAPSYYALHQHHDSYIQFII